GGSGPSIRARRRITIPRPGSAQPAGNETQDNYPGEFAARVLSSLRTAADHYTPSCWTICYTLVVGWKIPALPATTLIGEPHARIPACIAASGGRGGHPLRDV